MNRWIRHEDGEAHDAPRGVFPFVRDVESSEPSSVFDHYAAAWMQLLSTRPSGDSLELTPHARDFFSRIDHLHAQEPLRALKLLAILNAVCQFGIYDQGLRKFLPRRFTQLLLDERRSRKARIDWGLYCWSHWPSNYVRFENKFLIDPLMQLLIAETETDSAYVHEKIKAIRDPRSMRHDYVFNLFVEKTEDTLELATRLQDRDPVFLLACQARAIRKFADYQPSDETVDAIAADLVRRLGDHGTCSVEQREHFLVELVRCSNPQASWFEQTLSELWRIVAARGTPDETALLSLLVVTLNSTPGTTVASASLERFDAWAAEFRSFDNGSQVTRHAELLIRTVNDALAPKSTAFRNLAIPIPQASKAVESALSAYWRMVEWFRGSNPKLHFFALVSGLEMPEPAVNEVRKLAERARAQFLEHFEAFATCNVSDATEVLSRMIERSYYTGIKAQLCEVLEQAFPRLHAIDPRAALRVLEAGRKVENDYQHPWRPRVSP